MQKLLLPYNQQIPISSLNQNEPDRNYVHTQNRRSSTTSLGFSSSDESQDSSDPNENVVNLLHSIEKANDSYKHLVPFMNRIGYDFMSHCENSRINRHPFNFTLFFQYNSPTNQQTLCSISGSDLQNFLVTIPLPAINDCLKYLENIKEAFSKWLVFREKELERDARLLTLPLTNSFTPNLEQANDHGLTASESSSSPESNSSTTNPVQDHLNDESEKNSIEECLQCASVDTPEWRRGPYGPRSLCNACGLFYGKLIKRFGKEQAAVVMARRKSQGNGTDRRIPIE